MAANCHGSTKKPLSYIISACQASRSGSLTRPNPLLPPRAIFAIFHAAAALGNLGDVLRRVRPPTPCFRGRCGDKFDNFRLPGGPLAIWGQNRHTLG